MDFNKIHFFSNSFSKMISVHCKMLYHSLPNSTKNEELKKIGFSFIALCFSEALGNIIAQWCLFLFQQCRKIFQVKIYIVLKCKNKFNNIFCLISLEKVIKATGEGC